MKDQKINSRKAISIVMLFSAILLFASCEKFTDIKKNSAQIFISTAEDCQKLLDDYPVMNTGYPTEHINVSDEFCLTTSTLSGLTAEESGVHTWKPESQRLSANPQYQQPYYVIFKTNLVLEKLEKLKGGSTPQSTLDGIRAAALFYRAYNYWLLAQLYAPAYDPATADKDLGIVLRTSPDINDKDPRSTVKQTYERIIQDLKEGTVNLPAVANVVSRPGKAAAYAMLARVYLSMGDYTNAGLNADECLKIQGDILDYNTLSAQQQTSQTPFPRFNKEVLFQSVTGAATSHLYNYFARIVPSLYNSYMPDDLRRTVFFTDYGDGAGYAFKGNYEPNSYISLFTGLATDEVYLMRAECNARAGQLTQALDDLNTLLSKRWKTGTYVNLTTANPATDTQAEVLNKVLEERGKELVMRGLRWTDLRRLNREPALQQTAQRFAYNGSSLEVVATLPPNDKRYTLLIPVDVITESGMPQNPR